MSDKHRVICGSCSAGDHDACMGTKGRNACVCDVGHPDASRRAMPHYPDLEEPELGEPPDLGEERPTLVEDDVELDDDADEDDVTRVKT